MTTRRDKGSRGVSLWFHKSDCCCCPATLVGMLLALADRGWLRQRGGRSASRRTNCGSISNEELFRDSTDAAAGGGRRPVGCPGNTRRGGRSQELRRDMDLFHRWRGERRLHLLGLSKPKQRGPRHRLSRNLRWLSKRQQRFQHRQRPVA